MRFGDIIVKQIRGMAMGMSPAPSIANLFVAIYEASNILRFLNSGLFYLKRFVDDGFGIWVHDADSAKDAANWSAFKTAINGGGLTWIPTRRQRSVDFMDMTIFIENRKILTTIYEKPMALHQYIPPHSCHPPGVLTGLVMGQVLRFYQLCSKTEDIETKLLEFFGHLLDSGYKEPSLVPLFNRAIINAQKYISQSPEYRARIKWEKEEKNKRRVFLHPPYHPQNPPASKLQSLWRNIIASPLHKRPLNWCTNQHGEPIPIDQMVIAYSRAPNLGNLLSYRKICKRSGPKVSSYLIRH